MKIEEKLSSHFFLGGGNPPSGINLGCTENTYTIIQALESKSMPDITRP